MEAIDFFANSLGWIIALNAIVWVFFIFFAVKEIKGRRKRGKWVLKTFTDEYGYIYVVMPNGEKRDILVDVPYSMHYGKLKLGEPIVEAEREE